MFNAIYLTQSDDKRPQAELTHLEDTQLPERDVTVAVEWSTLNYKDGLAITGKGKVVRQFPLVPGIDLAGTVTHSKDNRFTEGDKVLLNGWEVGERFWGGLAQKACVSADWLTPLPTTMSPHDAMALGTAGYTAMLSVMALERHGATPAHGPVLVTGANGGVGSVAIMLLAQLGFEVIASTGRPEQADYLQALGAQRIISRDELSQPGRALGKVRWAAAVDTVGSHTLANVCAQLKEDGAVAACGLAQGMDLPATVAPFILRGVSLLGINSVTRPLSERNIAWQRLASTIDRDLLGKMTQDIGLDEVITAAGELLEGKIRGRLSVDVNR